MNLPTLGHSRTPEAVAANRKLLADARSRLKAEMKMIDALEGVNEALCDHPKKRDVYDPGYAGGGHDGYKCDACGKRGYF